MDAVTRAANTGMNGVQKADECDVKLVKTTDMVSPTLVFASDTVI